jgi:hypothetical protein
LTLEAPPSRRHDAHTAPTWIRIKYGTDVAVRTCARAVRLDVLTAIRTAPAGGSTGGADVP